jgi:phospholipid/cholesterol/gamma-HCH transport system substrate-binding protein
MGNKIVLLIGGTDESPLIKDGDMIAVEQTLTTDSLLRTLQRNNLNLLDITGDLKNVAKKITNGEGSIGKLLNDETLLNRLQNVVSIIKEASLNTRQITSNVESYSSRLQSKGSFTNDLITDTVIFSKLKAAVSQIQEVSESVGIIADHLQTASKSLNDSSKPVGALIHDRQIADTLKTILGNLRESSKKLDEDLEAVQHNFLFRGFFRKKAKHEAKNKN